MLTFLAPLILMQQAAQETALAPALAPALASASASAPEASPATPPTCEGEIYDALDFWVGEWDVYVTGAEPQEDGKQRIVASSKIEKLYSGCAIRENWMPGSSGPGGSLSGYNPKTGKWEQTWIGSSPGQVYFEGGPVAGDMVLVGTWSDVGGPGVDGLIRMTYTPNEADSSVRQFGQVSYDHGVSWAPSFDFTYRPKKEIVK